MTPYGFLLSHKKASGADGITPAQFLASGQRASGVHERPNGRVA